MSEQKSLPRRTNNRSRYMNTKELHAHSILMKDNLNRRWLAHGRSASQRQMLPHLSVAETAFVERPPPPTNCGGGDLQSTPDRPELSEAECDIDTLKKLKLGLRSSLWSRPSGGGGGGGANNPPSSDYSIAV